MTYDRELSDWVSSDGVIKCVKGDNIVMAVSGDKLYACKNGQILSLSEDRSWKMEHSLQPTISPRSMISHFFATEKQFILVEGNGTIHRLLRHSVAKFDAKKAI